MVSWSLGRLTPAEDREDLQISRKAYESTRDPERHTDAEPEEQKQILFRSFIFARHVSLSSQLLIDKTKSQILRTMTLPLCYKYSLA